MSPKDVHILSPQTCECGTPHDKRDFAVVIKLSVLRWEISLDSLGRSPVITRISIRGKQEGLSQTGGAMMEAEARRMRPRAKECRQPLEPGKGKETDSLS